MNQKSRLRFYLSFVIVHLCGAVGSAGTLQVALVFAGFITLSLLLLLGLRYGHDFYRVSALGGKQNQELLLAGQRISSEEVEASQEDRFLSLFTPGRAGGRKVLSFFLLFGGGVFCNTYLRLNFNLALGLMLLSCWLILNAGSVGQLLLSLGLNAVAVIAAHPFPGPWAFYPIYCALFLSCLASLRALGEESQYSEGLNVSWGRWLIHGVLFFGLCFSLSSLIPSRAPERARALDPSVREQAIARARTKEAKLQLSLKTLNHLAPMLPPESMVGTRRRIEGMILELGKTPQMGDEELRQFLKESVQMDRELEQEISELSQRIPLNGLRDFGSPDGENEGRLSEDEIRNFEEFSRDVDRVADKQLTGVEGQLEVLRKDPDLSSLERFQEGKEILRGLEEVRDLNRELGYLLSKSRGTGQYDPRIRELMGEVQSKEAAMQTRQHDYLMSQLPRPESFETTHDLNELANAERKEEDASEKLGKLLRALPFLVGFFILLWLRRLFGKKSIKELDLDNGTQVRELRRKWRSLKRRRLSAREEIIQFYNFFHESIQGIHYEGRETPPSCILREDLSDANPDLSKASYVVTEVFAQCFYGNKNVEEKGLRFFRGNLKKLLRFYRIG